MDRADSDDIPAVAQISQNYARVDRFLQPTAILGAIERQYRIRPSVLRRPASCFSRIQLKECSLTSAAAGNCTSTYPFSWATLSIPQLSLAFC
eukprot:6206430-Pleurochrysis_carterae.AAC.3